MRAKPATHCRPRRFWLGSLALGLILSVVPGLSPQVVAATQIAPQSPGSGGMAPLLRIEVRDLNNVVLLVGSVRPTPRGDTVSNLSKVTFTAWCAAPGDRPPLVPQMFGTLATVVAITPSVMRIRVYRRVPVTTGATCLQSLPAVDEYGYSVNVVLPRPVLGAKTSPQEFRSAQSGLDVRVEQVFGY